MASSNSSSSSTETEILDEVENDFKITIPLFKTIGFTQPFVTKINRGIFRVKIDRNFVYFTGLKFFALKEDGERKRNGYSINSIHISIYEANQTQITKLEEITAVCQLSSESEEIEFFLRKEVRLEPGIEYEIRYEYSGPKVRFGINRTSEPFMHYNRYVGTIGFSVQMTQGKNNRVAGLIFAVIGIKQQLPRGLPIAVEMEHLDTLFSNNKIDDIVKHVRGDATFCSKFPPLCATKMVESLKAKLNVEIHADYAMKETVEKYSKHSVELKFRCNKRIVIDGMFFNGWTLPSDAKQKKSIYLVENLEIVEAATKLCLASSEKSGFEVPTELKIPLIFIHSWPIAPDVWHILKLEFNGPIMRYGTKPRSTISLDKEKEGEKVVWTLDLENSKNTETLHSLAYQFSEDQSKEAAAAAAASPDQEC